MSKLLNIIAGMAGAAALNLLHESLKHKSVHTPRIDKLGEAGVQKTASFLNTPITDQETLYTATLASDLSSNAFYYSLIGSAGRKFLWPKAIISGLSAGIGALKLPEPMGLNAAPVNKTQGRKALVVAYSLTGALVTAAVLRFLDKPKHKTRVKAFPENW